VWREAFLAGWVTATPAAAATALLGVPAAAPTDDRTTALRELLRQDLSQPSSSSLPGGPLLSEELHQVRLRGPAGPPLDLAGVQTLLRDADAAFAALEHERSVTLLETAIGHLEADRDFSVEKRALLESARVTCAQRLVGLAGPTETGKGDTPRGRRAREQLAAVVRSHPSFVLDPQRYAPKLRALLALAAEDVKRAGQGDLQVVSTPPGVNVVLDGRTLGQTPLLLHQGVPAGRFRLWLDDGAARSFTRVVDVATGDAVRSEIDFAFEGSIHPASAGLQPLRPWTPTDWQRLAGLLDVDTVVLAGADPAAAADGAGAATVWAAVVDGQTGAVLRGARVPAGQEASLVAMVRGAAGDAGFTLPLSLAVPPSAPIVEESAPSPWLAVGVGVGGIVLVGVTTAIVLALTTTTQPTFAVSVVGAP
jgi:hypothetical protein